MEHLVIPAGEIHAPHNWEFASAAAREGDTTITDPAMVGRMALQMDDGSYWRLTGVAPLAWASVGGLSFVSESRSTATPNNLIPVHQIAALGAEADIDLALTPKGSGALTAQAADGTATGGYKRGAFAVDWQMARSASGSSVASGDYSLVAGGKGNTASGDYSIAQGDGNNASGMRAAALSGHVQTASGVNSVICGGGVHIASGNNSAIGGGHGNRASGMLSFIPGGRYGDTRSIFGMEAVGSMRFSASGDAQRGAYMLGRATADATPTPLSCDGNAPNSTTSMVLPNNAAYDWTANVVARSDTGEVASWRAEGTILRNGTAATTALVGTPTITQKAASAGTTGWSITVDADTTNGALRINVTGAALTNIRWVAKVETVEVIY